MSPSASDLLRHILDEIDYLLSQHGRFTKADLLADGTLQRAYSRSIEVIGEAARQMPGEFRNQHPDVPWKTIAGMRDRLIHAYFAVARRNDMSVTPRFRLRTILMLMTVVALIVGWSTDRVRLIEANRQLSDQISYQRETILVLRYRLRSVEVIEKREELERLARLRSQLSE
jgi:uncharacterized protein with HEPN domain